MSWPWSAHKMQLWAIMHGKTIDWDKITECVFGYAFMKLILDIIDFIRIDLVRINFELK